MPCYDVNSGPTYNTYFVIFLHPGLKWYWIENIFFLNSEFANVENISPKLGHFSAVISLRGQGSVLEI